MGEHKTGTTTHEAIRASIADRHVVPAPLCALDDALKAAVRDDERRRAELAAIRTALYRADSGSGTADTEPRASVDDAGKRPGIVIPLGGRGSSRPAAARPAAVAPPPRRTVRRDGGLTGVVAAAVGRISDQPDMFARAAVIIVGIGLIFMVYFSKIGMGTTNGSAADAPVEGPAAIAPSTNVPNVVDTNPPLPGTEAPSMASAPTNSTSLPTARPHTPVASPATTSGGTPGAPPPTQNPTAWGVALNVRLTSYTSFELADLGWRDTQEIQVVRLTVGVYHVRFPAADPLSFAVEQTGEIDYDSRLDPFMSGRGSSTLTISGAPISVDMTDVDDTSGVVAGTRRTGTSRVHTYRLVPGPHRLVGSAGAGAGFTVGYHGTVDYEASLNGVLSGRGTALLVVHGLPITLDATATLPPRFLIVGVGWRESRQPQVVRLLPGTNRVTIAEWRSFTFTVEIPGSVEYDHELDGFLSGRGTATLTITQTA